MNDSDASCSSASSCKSSHNSTVDAAAVAISLGPTCLTEPILYSIIEVCQKETSYAFLIRTLGEVFSSRELIAQSFQKSSKSTLDAMLEKAPNDLKSMKKEDLRALENDPDKDEDCLASKEEPRQPHYTTVDLPSLKRSVKKLFEISLIFDPLNTALQNLGTSLSCEIRLLTKKEKIEEIITVFVIVFELIHNGASEFLEVALPSICCACAHLPIWAQARLASIWAEHCKEDLSQILVNLQQLVTLQVIQGDYFGDYHIQSNEIVANATKVMKIVYYANMLAGEIEPAKYREDDPFETTQQMSMHDDDDDNGLSWSTIKALKPSSTQNISQDPLAAEISVTILDCRKPYMPFEEFYNETLSDNVEMAHDYLNYTKNNMNLSEPNSHFSFMLGYSFILTTATKTQGLFYGNRVRMFTERRLSEYQISGHSHSPYLRLKVRRDHIIDDALVELEMFAMANPKDLKKQLKVEFAGEQGIDEGGVSKEFFQLIVEEIFNPDYGMFVHNVDSRNVWFNPTSFENEAQFTLIGIVLGLAIYNSIILPVNFPMVVYRKLMGMKGSFRDLEDFSPVS